MKSRILRFSIFLILTALLLISIGCSKKETEPVTPPSPVPTDSSQYETPFAEVPDIPDIIMYEINERAFSTSGDFAGILPRLDSIRALSVNVIWLMPVHPIGVIKTVNSPYCVKNYKEVNPEYGDLEDLRTLVREAHKRKMAVILDWVANHTSWDNPWIQNKSWYTQDGAGNIIIPPGTNWQDVADLNFDNSDMRLEMIKCMKYWLLIANIDGYRCDAADFVPFSFWKQAIDSLKKVPNRKIIMLAEGARSDHFDAGFQMNFGWDFFIKNKNVFKNNQSASGYYQTHQSEYSSIPTGSHKLRFTSNHDECAWDDTPLGLFGGKNASLSAFVISAYMGGVPLIYNGQEVGCPVKLPFFSRSPIDWTTNPDMFKEYKWIMSLHATHPALQTGELEYYPDSNIAAFKRKESDDEVVVIVNTRNAVKNFNIPANIQNTTWQNASSDTTVYLGSQLSLNAFEYLILIK
ncbi:MAG: alpha-amylase family glycosyl hydrolase [Bacteroidetes bacterium]|nr:alpha-amylase family glycosyl hydrolase [Bacteroidota bacterium]